MSDAELQRIHAEYINKLLASAFHLVEEIDDFEQRRIRHLCKELIDSVKAGNAYSAAHCAALVQFFVDNQRAKERKFVADTSKRPSKRDDKRQISDVERAEMIRLHKARTPYPKIGVKLRRHRDVVGRVIREDCNCKKCRCKRLRRKPK